MRKNKEVKEKKTKNKLQKQYDKGQIFVKIMAGILALIMIMSIAVSLIYSLIQVLYKNCNKRRCTMEKSIGNSWMNFYNENILKRI